MAITISSQPSIETGAFGKNVIVATTSSAATRFKYELLVGGNTEAIQYSPIFAYIGELSLGDAQGVFTVNGLYSSLLPSFNNPILGISSSFIQVDTFNHQKLITDRITEDIVGGAVTNLLRRIYKSTDTKYLVNGYWNASGTEKFMAFTRSNIGVLRHVFDGQHIPISFFTNTPTTGTYIQRINAGGTTNLGLTNINQKFRVATWKVSSDYDYNTISLSGAVIPLQIVIDRKCYPKRKTLYFLNKFGGWEWFNFIDYEATNKTDKKQLTQYINMEGDTEVSQYIEGDTKEYKLYGVEGTADYVGYIRDLVSSPIVLDEAGIRVRVISNNIAFDGDSILSPEVTIQYKKDHTINF